jgi:hypothetical protein
VIELSEDSDFFGETSWRFYTNLSTDTVYRPKIVFNEGIFLT